MSARSSARNLSIEMIEIPRMELTNVCVNDDHTLIELWAKDEQQRELLGRLATGRNEGDQLLVELNGMVMLRKITTIRLRQGFFEKDKLVLQIILGPAPSEQRPPELGSL